MICTGDAAGAGVRTETGRTKTVVETGSHPGAGIVVEVGMGNGATNGRTFDSVLDSRVSHQFFTDENMRALKSARLARLRKSVPKLRKRPARWQS